MRIYVIVFLMAQLIFLEECKYSKNTPSISYGTTILMFVDKDSIIMAADSRVIKLTNNAIADTAIKIHQVNNVVYGIAGISSFNSHNIYLYINKIYRKKLTLIANAELISDSLQLLSYRFLNQMDSRVKRSLDLTDEKFLKIEVLMATYENKKQVCCYLQIYLKRIGDRYLAMKANPDTSQAKFWAMGETNFIATTLTRDSNYFTNSDKKKTY